MNEISGPEIVFDMQSLAFLARKPKDGGGVALDICENDKSPHEFNQLGEDLNDKYREEEDRFKAKFVEKSVTDLLNEPMLRMVFNNPYALDALIGTLIEMRIDAFGDPDKH